VDIERLREIMTELLERSAAVVRRYGGGSVEYTGDGVIALFGAPIALENHAFRACLAALAIQQEANRLAGEVARRDGVVLRLRVALNSGRVIAGEIGSSSRRPWLLPKFKMYASTYRPRSVSATVNSASITCSGGITV
jgi:class 3 adenylate cyclase